MRAKKSDNSGVMISIDNVSLGDILGKGSFAKVYRGTHRDKRVLAVKVVDIKEKGSRDCALRYNSLHVILFFSEIAVLLRLRHNNIVEMFSHVYTKGSAFLFLEYLPGKTLKEILQRGVFSEKYLRTIARPICEALTYAHSMFIPHRDVKPDNIIVTIENKIKLIDWGFAFHVSKPNALCNDFAGSPLYKAPELIANIPHDPFLADIWAFGVTCYELLTGETPYETNDYSVLVYKSQHVSIYYPPVISSSAKAFLSQLLQKEPKERVTMNNLLSSSWLTTV